MNNLSTDLLLIVDSDSRAIACTAPTFTTARAVLLSSLKIGMFSVPIARPWCPAEFKKIDFNDLNKSMKLYDSDKRGVKPLKTAEYTPTDAATWKKKRQDLQLRVGYLDALDWQCQNTMIPTTETPYINGYIPSILHELNMCDPNRNYYTPAIEVYANITDCSPAAAYQELRMHTDNINHVRMRNSAIYIKYRNMLNNAPAVREEQQKVMEMAKEELFRNSLV